jgi:hypothetical protein
MTGGSVWESNPPGTRLTCYNGFEVRRAHQAPIRSQKPNPLGIFAGGPGIVKENRGVGVPENLDRSMRLPPLVPPATL